MADRAELWMDSGAFTAWTRKEQIDIDEYIRFCLDRLNIISYVVNLDVIPGEFGQKDLPPEEIERSAGLGYQNYHYMLSRGIPKEKLIHVFHQGENFKWLAQMVAEIPYIGLSPANDRTTPEKIMWLDQCMPYVIDDQGYPVVKFHGFAVTAPRLMFRYPWYSVDSTTWQMMASNGHILMPRKVRGQYNYSQPWYTITISSESSRVKEAGHHYNTLSAAEQQEVVKYIESKGFTLEEMQTNYLKRSELNVIYFKDLGEHLTPWPNKRFEISKSQVRGFGL